MYYSAHTRMKCSTWRFCCFIIFVSSLFTFFFAIYCNILSIFLCKNINCYRGSSRILFTWWLFLLRSPVNSYIAYRKVILVLGGFFLPFFFSMTRLDDFYLFVHLSIIYTTYRSGSQGGWRQSQLTSCEKRGTPWASRQSIAGLTPRRTTVHTRYLYLRTV